jgi:sugar phosphate isomerase/epimerase
LKKLSTNIAEPDQPDKIAMQKSRRRFLQYSTSSAASLLFSSIGPFAQTQPEKFMSAGYQLKVLATNWGYEGTIDSFCGKVKEVGYDGIEIWWPTTKPAQDELFAALSKHNLDVGFLCGGSDANAQKHFDQFKAMVEPAATQQIQRPLYINCHSGRDHFSYDQNKQFIDLTTQLTKTTGVIICHESHRSRILFAAPVARNYIEKIPELRMTLDISHWCNVHESMLTDQEETVSLAISRTDHIHARIGHPEGPQVNDPRAPEWDKVVASHFEWWDKVIAKKKADGKTMTMLTEFGPPDYMPTLPYTRQPVANQWDINVHMMNLLRKRYS